MKVALCYKDIPQGDGELNFIKIPIFLIKVDNNIIGLEIRHDHINKAIKLIAFKVDSYPYGTKDEIGTINYDDISSLDISSMKFILTNLIITGSMKYIVEFNQSHDSTKIDASIEDIVKLYNSTHFDTFIYLCNQFVHVIAIDGSWNEYNQSYLNMMIKNLRDIINENGYAEI